MAETVFLCFSGNEYRVTGCITLTSQWLFRAECRAQPRLGRWRFDIWTPAEKHTYEMKEDANSAIKKNVQRETLISSAWHVRLVFSALVAGLPPTVMSENNPLAKHKMIGWHFLSCWWILTVFFFFFYKSHTERKRTKRHTYTYTDTHPCTCTDIHTNTQIHAHIACAYTHWRWEPQTW